jgi:DNA-binding IclR family transcriptional regulator
MKEQDVQYTEPTYIEEGISSTSVAVTPAPMVERAFRLLDLLGTSEDGLTLSDLARALSMSKGSIHGLLKTLESNGVIEQSEDRRYILGPRIYDLAQAYVQRAGLRHFALPAMHRLATSVNETLFLGKIEQNGVRIIECIVDEGERPALRISAPRGTRVHLLAGATGRLVLASWPISQRKEYLQTHPLPRFTEHSITDTEQFLALVDEVARTGISIDREEYLVGVNAVAAPIYGAGGVLVALLWIVGFTSRFKDDVLDQAAHELHIEAEAISRSLGAK